MFKYKLIIISLFSEYITTVEIINWPMIEEFFLLYIIEVFEGLRLSVIVYLYNFFDSFQLQAMGWLWRSRRSHHYLYGTPVLLLLQLIQIPKKESTLFSTTETDWP